MEKRVFFFHFQASEHHMKAMNTHTHTQNTQAERFEKDFAVTVDTIYLKNNQTSIFPSHDAFKFITCGNKTQV